MQSTFVRIGRMDDRRPGEVVALPVTQLGLAQRLGRAIKRLLMTSGVGLLFVNFAFLLIPVPHVHLCTLPLVLVLGPVVAWFTWREKVLLGQSELRCPRCSRPTQVPQGLAGWPARFNCLQCGVMVELHAAHPSSRGSGIRQRE